MHYYVLKQTASIVDFSGKHMYIAE